MNPFILCSDVKLKRHGQSLSQWEGLLEGHDFFRQIFCWWFRSYSDLQMQFHKALYPKPYSWHENGHLQMAQGLSACTTSLRVQKQHNRKRETAVDWVGEQRRSTPAIPFTSSSHRGSWHVCLSMTYCSLCIYHDTSKLVHFCILTYFTDLQESKQCQ